MKLTKQQIDSLAVEIRDQLQNIGQDHIDAIKARVMEDFLQTKEGRMVKHLRVALKDDDIGDSHISFLQQKQLKGFKQPFSYVRASEAAHHVAVASIDANSSEEIIKAVLKKYFSGLPANVRRKFKLSIK
jgi:hypothetical protein